MINLRRFFLLKKSDPKNKKTYNFNLIGRYFYKRLHPLCHQVISDKISADIDLEELFVKIDRTTTAIGQQYLYAKIRTVKKKEELFEFDTYVSAFERDNSLQSRICALLSKLTQTKGYSIEGYYFEELINLKQIEVGSLKIPYVTSLLFIFFAGLSFFYFDFILCLIPLYIFNLVLHYKNKQKINYCLWGVSEFYRSMKVAKVLIKEPIVNRQFKDVQFLSNLKGAERKASLIVVEQRYENEITAIVFSIIELFKIPVNFEVILFHFLLRDLIKEHDSLEQLFGFIGETDSAISVAELRATNELCKPVFVEKKFIEVADMVHPLVKECIPNSILLENKSLLLTGSNMAGKSTFIRSVALNALLAQTIFCCFAKEYRAPFFKLFTSICIRDSVEEHTSYFLEEVLTIKEFLSEKASHDRCLFVLDEIFKGTNTLERVAAGKSVLSFLNDGEHLVFASTHDVELTRLLRNRGYDFFYFCENISDNQLCFDYKLREGVSKTTNAIKILELYGFPSSVITDATNYYNHQLNEPKLF